MKYKLVVADFDGTLGKAPNFISEKTLMAIKEYVESGGKFVICTGRALNSIKEICDHNGISGTVIAFQGALIAELSGNEILFRGGVDAVTAAELIEELEKEDVDVLTYSDGKLLFTRDSEYVKVYEKLCSIKGECVPLLKERISEIGNFVPKVMALVENERLPKISEKMREKFGKRVIVNSGAECLIEIINPECSKGQAVRFLANHFGIKEEEIITIGDSTNDLTLIEVGYGVAVGDGNEELKKAAKEVTVPFSEDPVEHILRKYCL